MRFQSIWQDLHRKATITGWRVNYQHQNYKAKRWGWEMRSDQLSAQQLTNHRAPKYFSVVWTLNKYPQKRQQFSISQLTENYTACIIDISIPVLWVFSLTSSKITQVLTRAFSSTLDTKYLQLKIRVRLWQVRSRHLLSKSFLPSAHTLFFLPRASLNASSSWSSSTRLASCWFRKVKLSISCCSFLSDWSFIFSCSWMKKKKI